MPFMKDAPFKPVPGLRILAWDLEPILRSGVRAPLKEFGVPFGVDIRQV